MTEHIDLILDVQYNEYSNVAKITNHGVPHTVEWKFEDHHISLENVLETEFSDEKFAGFVATCGELTFFVCKVSENLYLVFDRRQIFLARHENGKYTYCRIIIPKHQTSIDLNNVNLKFMELAIYNKTIKTTLENNLKHCSKLYTIYPIRCYAPITRHTKIPTIEQVNTDECFHTISNWPAWICMDKNGNRSYAFSPAYKLYTFSQCNVVTFDPKTNNKGFSFKYNVNQFMDQAILKDGDLFWVYTVLDTNLDREEMLTNFVHGMSITPLTNTVYSYSNDVQVSYSNKNDAIKEVLLNMIYWRPENCLTLPFIKDYIRDTFPEYFRTYGTY